MLTKVGPGSYEHKDGDSFRLDVAVEGTGKKTIAAIGDRKITLPIVIGKDDYKTFKPRYSINVIFTFTQDATDKAKYTLTISDSDGNVVARSVIRPPKNKPLPAMVLRNYDFEVV